MADPILDSAAQKLNDSDVGVTVADTTIDNLTRNLKDLGEIRNKVSSINH